MLWQAPLATALAAARVGIRSGDQQFGAMQVHFHPKELLSSILRVYTHLLAGDRGNSFAAAIAADGRSYRHEHFTEAWRIVTELGLPSFDSALVGQLQQLTNAVQAAAAAASADDQVRPGSNNSRSRHAGVCNGARVLVCVALEKIGHVQMLSLCTPPLSVTYSSKPGMHSMHAAQSSSLVDTLSQLHCAARHSSMCGHAALRGPTRSLFGPCDVHADGGPSAAAHQQHQHGPHHHLAAPPV